MVFGAEFGVEVGLISCIIDIQFQPHPDQESIMQDKPPRAKTYRCQLPRPDERGRIRPIVGRCQGPDGTTRPVRFTVGTRNNAAPADMMRRLEAIRNLYARQCTELQIDHWKGWVLQFANRLAQGIPIVVYDDKDPCKGFGSSVTADYWGIILQLQAWGVPIAVADPRLQQTGYAHVRAEMDAMLEQAKQQVLSELRETWGNKAIEAVGTPPSDQVAVGTLHKALSGYIDYIREHGKQDSTGGLTSGIRKNIEQLEALRAAYDDLPLWRLDLDGIERLVGHWRNRPKTKRGHRCSASYAKRMIKTLWRLLNWIDKQPVYHWTMPKGAADISHKPVALAEDHGKHETAFRTTTKKTYTPEQLAAIVKHADKFDKAIIGVAVNCAFGASEIGQWRMSDYQLHVKHPHAASVGIESTNADSWIVGKRPKSGIYGEHLLWEEVAQAIKPFMDGREVLPLTKGGKPWYRPHSANAQSQFSNWWTALVAKAQAEHADLPQLPFGSLRDLLPNILRRDYSAEVASLALQHGKLCDDDLLKLYANLPFGKLFTATRELRGMFKPFLDAIVA